MKNIHLIPTDKPSILYAKDDNYKLANSTMAMDWYISSAGYRPYNIYITSDEEIKEGDWVLSGNKIYQIKESAKDFLNHVQGISKKIILTTDQDLIKDGVQSIDDEFLEWFVKNPSCESVEVKNYKSSEYPLNYKIIIPRETLSYTEVAKKDERIFNSTIMKQETLEEVAKNYASKKLQRPITIYSPLESNVAEYVGFIEGAKSDAARDYWFEIFLKQERMYSEEEILDAWELGAKEGLPLTKKKKEELFKQFKKK
jgi:hypothetical protein